MSKSKYDNDFKREVIEKGALKSVLQQRKQLYYDSKYQVLNEQLGTLETHYDSNKWNEYFYANINDKFFDCSLRLLESKKRKYSRAREKIEKIIKDYEQPIFITLTFTDKVLQETSTETRRRYVARFLKEHCKDYVANIDFSPKKNREHYHAVISSRVDFTKWNQGFIFTEQVRKNGEAAKQISHYINKLTSHAFKVNATRLIYSRNDI